MMTILFEDDDLRLAFAQKRRIFWAYMAVVAAFVAVCVACIVYFVSLPYEDSYQAIPKTIMCVAVCLFIIFSHIFLGIKYHRVRRYYKMLAAFSSGIKMVNHSRFLRYEGVDAKDGVDCHVLIFSEWSKKKSDYLDRKIYSDKEKPCPQFEKGDIVSYFTHANVLLGYEVVGRDETFRDAAAEEDQARNEAE